MITTKETPIKPFNVASGVLRVTDPCYTPDTRCAGQVQALRGRWYARAGICTNPGDKDRVAYLKVYHELYWVSAMSDMEGWTREDIDVGVDSGQAGFFDADAYADAYADGNGSPRQEEFYERVCRLTDEPFGTLEFGAVSRTGYGDGGYDCYTVRNTDGVVVAAAIVYIGGPDDEEEEEEEEEEVSSGPRWPEDY